MTIEAGDSLGPYEILGAIGAGGMGEVYRARDTRLGRMVAVKILSPDVARDEARLARFEREARLCSSLNHPNIVTIYELGQHEDLTYIAMELVDGKSLRSLTTGAVPVRKLLSIAAQTAGGMAAAHGAGIVHRDLKPENVMLTPSGSVKILDFGLAKTGVSSRDATTSLQLTGERHVVGTAAYMSPEQAAGREVDFRSDQFALGAVLYELASGKHPFRRATTLEMLAAIHEEDPPSLAEVDPALPEPFVWIVERCLAKEPSERYASTTDLARDLERLRDASQGRLSGTIARRRRVSRWVIATVILGLTAIALATALVLRPAPRSSRGPLYVDLSLGDMSTPAVETFSPLAVAPDGRSLVLSGGGPQHLGLFLRELASTTAKPIAGTERGYAPEISPDGRHVAFFADGKLKTVPIAGGAARIVCDALDEGNASWGADGRILLAQSGADGSLIYSVDASGGTPARVTRLDARRHEVYHRWPEHLPDGKHFLYVAGARPPGSAGIQSTLMVASLDGRTTKAVGRIDSRALFHKGRLLFARGGALLSQPFDLDTMRLTGEPSLIAESLYFYRPSGMAAFDVGASGTVAYRSPREESSLTIVTREGVPVADLVQGTLDREAGRVSPDGTRLAVGLFDPKAGAADIWIHDLVRGGAVRLTYDEADDTRPVWSADGRTLFLRSDAAGPGGPPDVYRVDLQSGTKQLLYHGADLDEPADAAPDGTELIVDHWAVGGRDLTILPLASGAKPRDLVRTPFEEAQARFSPDGKWIAYQSNVTGRYDVYVIPFPERGAPLRVTPGGGRLPRWGASGHELFFLARGEITTVDVIRNGTALSFGPPKVVFHWGKPVSDFEPLRDSKRFVVRSPEVGGAEMHLVVDAFPE